MARVVVADDQGPVRRSLARALTEKRHVVLQAANGHEVLWQLQGGPVDVVVTDIVMAEMDGIETLQNVRASYPHVPIIVVSGQDRSTPYLNVAEMLGAARTFRKPVDPEKLHQVIVELTSS